MWAAIGNVTTWVGLLAVVVGAGFYVVRERSRREENQIRSAPEADRAQLVTLALEKFHIDTSNLKGRDVVTLGLAQLHSRTVRLFIVAVVLALLGIGVIIATVVITSSHAAASSPAQSGAASPGPVLQTASPAIASSPDAAPPASPPTTGAEATPTQPPRTEPAPSPTVTARATPARSAQPALTPPAPTPPSPITVSSTNQSGGITAGTINNTGTINVVNGPRPPDVKCDDRKLAQVDGKYRWTFRCQLDADAMLPDLTVAPVGPDAAQVVSVQYELDRGMYTQGPATLDGMKAANLENAPPGPFRVVVTTIGAQPPPMLKFTKPRR